MTNSLRHSGDQSNQIWLNRPRIEVEAEPIDESIEDPPASNWTNLFAEIDKELHKWNCSLIAYFIGETPRYKAMQRTKRICKKFSTMDLIQSIKKPIILKPWSIDFDLSKEFPTKIPLWVKFPNLPMTCWSKDSLSRIASTVGKSVYADECTAK
ncbi:hypothetical protein H5410_060384 [Solanum commersonii]|uniref:DUF4283 domain-containing protein n=1 Tax=Solanum commersonii TaxID=4109 RepID=A0A9J5W527_SOLCO|nr:hypothetical protein H5410_060384 [Solanum commersonii]